MRVESAEAIALSRHRRRKLWVASPPAGPVGHFADRWHDPGNSCEKHSITAAQCPRLSPEFIGAGLQLLTRAQIREATVETLTLGLDTGKRQNHTALTVLELPWPPAPRTTSTSRFRPTRRWFFTAPSINATGIGYRVLELIRQNQTRAHLQPVMRTAGHVEKHRKDRYLSQPRENARPRRIE